MAIRLGSNKFLYKESPVTSQDLNDTFGFLDAYDGDTTFTYNTDGTIQKITLSNSYTINFTYSSGAVSQITYKDELGNVIETLTFTYTNNVLTKITKT